MKQVFDELLTRDYFIEFYYENNKFSVFTYFRLTHKVTTYNFKDYANAKALYDDMISMIFKTK